MNRVFGFILLASSFLLISSQTVNEIKVKGYLIEISESTEMESGIVTSVYYDFFVPDSVPVSELYMVINSNLDTIVSPAVLVKKTNKFTVNRACFLDSNQVSFRINDALNESRYLMKSKGLTRKTEKTVEIVYAEFLFEFKIIPLQEFAKDFWITSHNSIRIPLTDETAIQKTYYLKEFNEIASDLKSEGKILKLRDLK